MSPFPGVQHCFWRVFLTWAVSEQEISWTKFIVSQGDSEGGIIFASCHDISKSVVFLSFGYFLKNWKA